MSINWELRAEQALENLIATDHQLAELKTRQERDKRKAKRIWSAIYLRVEGANIEERKAHTESHADYQSAVAAEMTSLLEYEKLRNERATNQLTIDFWRSWQRAVREGEI